MSQRTSLLPLQKHTHLDKAELKCQDKDNRLIHKYHPNHYVFRSDSWITRNVKFVKSPCHIHHLYL